MISKDFLPFFWGGKWLRKPSIFNIVGIPWIPTAHRREERWENGWDILKAEPRQVATLQIRGAKFAGIELGQHRGINPMTDPYVLYAIFVVCHLPSIYHRYVTAFFCHTDPMGMTNIPKVAIFCLSSFELRVFPSVVFSWTSFILKSWSGKEHSVERIGHHSCEVLFRIIWCLIGIREWGKIITTIWLVVELATWKLYTTSSLGMMKFPIYGEITHGNQTINKMGCLTLEIWGFP